MAGGVVDAADAAGGEVADDPAQHTPAARAAALPPLATLTPASDFSAFLKDEVDEALRRQALKKLFADPRFNCMDGLDVYIDDYSLPAPIPSAALARLRHARALLNDGEEGGARAADRALGAAGERCAADAAAGDARAAATPAGPRVASGADRGLCAAHAGSPHAGRDRRSSATDAADRAAGSDEMAGGADGGQAS
jgi:hypothetical protein